MGPEEWTMGFETSLVQREQPECATDEHEVRRLGDGRTIRGRAGCDDSGSRKSIAGEERNIEDLGHRKTGHGLLSRIRRLGQ